MLKTPWVGIALAAAVMAGAACKKKDETKPTEKVVSNEKGSAEAKPTAKIGLENPANDPKVVAAVKQLLADCGKTLDETTGDSKKPNERKGLYRCEKWGADFGDLQFEKADATFVNLLEDPDIKVRTVGVSGLGKGWDWHGDKALATKVVEGLKKEKAPSPIDHNWALRVADISSSAGLDDQIKALATDPKSSNDVKRAIMAWWSGDAAYQAVKANATSTDPEIIDGVVQGYVKHFKDHTEEACAFWEQHLDNSYALGHMTGGWNGNTTGDSESEDYITGGGGGPTESDDKRCKPEQLSKALDLIEKDWAAGKDNDKGMYALGFLAKDKLTPAPLKERAVKDLKAMVEKKGFWMRGSALRTLVDSGDPAHLKYAQKFAKDEDLKSTVENINKGAKEKAEREKKEKAEKAKK